MSDFSTFQTSPAEIKDPELKKFVDQITDLLKMSVYQSVYSRSQSKPMKYEKLKVGVKKVIDYDPVGKVVDDWVATREPVKVKAFEENAGVRAFMVRSPLTNGVSRINFKAEKYTSAQLDSKVAFSYVGDRFINRLETLFDLPVLEAIPVVPRRATQLKLFLTNVKCVDETNPEWWGKDEISAGGVAIDDKQQETKINEFSVGSFNDGGQKNYQPAKVLKTFNLDAIDPSTFVVLLSLAEKDNGGFSTFLNKLYESIKAELGMILAGLGAAAGAGIGAAIGGSVGTAIAGPVGTAIGIVAGLILGALVAWLCNAFNDDIFEPQVIGVHLLKGIPFTGPRQTVTYRDFGGVYTAQIYWQAI